MPPADLTTPPLLLRGLVPIAVVQGAVAGLVAGPRPVVVVGAVGLLVVAARTARHKPGAALALLLIEVTVLVYAAVASAWADGYRLFLGVTASTMLALVLASLRTFPEPELP